MASPRSPDIRDQAEAFARNHLTGMVTLLFTDMVDSTALKQQLGRQSFDFFEQHHRLIRDALTGYPNAREIETAGDSFFLIFAVPSDAVEFALVLQSKLRALFQGAGAAAQDRIGIHLGEVVIREADAEHSQRGLFGLQVDTCSRVMGLAAGGQILMTRPVFDSARQVLKTEALPGLEPLSWVSHGFYQLKGVEDPVEVCEVAEIRRGLLKAPTTSDKARRYESPVEEEPVLGWRPAVGQTIPGTPWVMEESLGHGGFGEVWLGRHRSLKDLRVFKFCFRTDRVRSLKREVTLFKVLKERIGGHPNIVGIQDVFFDEPPYYVMMDYAAGQDLVAWCAARGGIEMVPLETRLEIVAQVAEALQAAHDAGIIHRDVKPANILVEGGGEDGKPVHVRLTDFGIGQVLSAEYLAGVTQAGFTRTMLADSDSSSRSGTQLYMAPELLAGKAASIRSDIYSLGVVLYQLLIGNLNHPLTIDWMQQIQDAILCEDLEHCFARRPVERFAAAEQLAKNLRSYAERTREAAKREQLQRNAIRRRRLAWAALGIAALLILLAGTLGYGLVRAQAERDLARLYAYTADMKLADLALKKNNLGQAVSLLKAYFPQTGKQDLRGIEWRYLWQRCQGDQVTTRPQPGPVLSIDISPDGQWMAAAAEGRFLVWNVERRDSVRELGEGAPTGLDPRQCLCFHPTGSVLAVATPKEVVLWDTETWQRIHALKCSSASLDFSGDGSALATFGNEGMHVWETSDWKLRAGPEILQIPAEGERDVAMNGDGTLVAAALSKALIYSQVREDEVALWRLPAGKRLVHTADPIRPMNIALSNDGAWLAVGTWSGEVRLWKVGEQLALPPVPAHIGLVFGLAFSPDSRTLVSGGNDQLIQFWQPGQTEPQFTLHGHWNEIWGLRFSADGQWLISGSKDATVRRWKPSPPVEKKSFPLPPNRMPGSLSADGSILNAVNPAGWVFEEWDTATGGCTRQLPLKSSEPLDPLIGQKVQRYTFIVSWEDFNAPEDADPEKIFWVTSGEYPWTLSASSCNGRVYVWDQQTGERAVSVKLADSQVLCIPRSAGSLLGGLARAGPGKWHMIIRDEKNGRHLATLTDCRFGTPLSYPVVAELHLGAYPSTNDWIGVIREDRVIARIPFPAMDLLRAAAISPDGKYLAAGSADGTAQIWEVATRRPVGPPLVGHLSGLEKLSFSPDGKTLVTYSNDGTARMWNVATGREMISGIPVNDLLLQHLHINLLLEDGNAMVESTGPDSFRILRLPTLAEIDAEQTDIQAR